jgi:hypothetical protein
MSFINPSRQARTIAQFWVLVVQAFAIIGGGLWAAYTYHNQTKDQQQHAIEQAEAVKRELRRPYDEKQLSLYLEAARVVADLAVLPKGEERDKAERRFWELYWGELAFVESTPSNPPETGIPIETMMRHFCAQLYKESDCDHAKSVNPRLGDALNFSRQARDEIIIRWRPNKQ